MTKTEGTDTEQRATAQIALFGEYRFKVDAKGRIALPAKFRKALPKELVVARRPDSECLFVFTSQGFIAWVKKLFRDSMGEQNSAYPKHNNTMTSLYRLGEGVEVDSSGRINLRSAVREAAGIDKDVVLVGTEDHFEIWAANKYCSDVEEFDLTTIYKDPDE